MNCTEMSAVMACYNDGIVAPRTLVAHYEYRQDENGSVILYATRYTEIDGVTVVDTTGGTVTAGACAMIPPDVEYERLCDTDAAGVVTEFFRRSITSFNTAGVPTIAVTDWALDKITPYVVAGTVGACNKDCDVIPSQGVQLAWGGVPII